MESFFSKQEVRSAEPKYLHILVQPEEGPLQVTFDNNEDNNVCNYHLQRDWTHITEYFQILPVGGKKVMISGYVAPRPPQLYLSLREDPAGVPDRYPRFREEKECKPLQVEETTWHTEFILEEDAANNIALSFRTVRDSAKVYLVPTSNQLRRIKTKMTDDAAYVFRRGSTITKQELFKLQQETTTATQDVESEAMP